MAPKRAPDDDSESKNSQNCLSHFFRLGSLCSSLSAISKEQYKEEGTFQQEGDSSFSENFSALVRHEYLKERKKRRMNFIPCGSVGGGAVCKPSSSADRPVEERKRTRPRKLSEELRHVVFVSCVAIAFDAAVVVVVNVAVPPGDHVSLEINLEFF